MLHLQEAQQPPNLGTIVRRILVIYLKNESKLATVANSALKSERLSEAFQRIYLLQQTEDFSYFFSFIAHRAPDLLPSCQCLVFGGKLSQNQKVPTFEQLQRVIHLVREERPRLQDFTRRLIADSVLGKVVGVERFTQATVVDVPGREAVV